MRKRLLLLVALVGIMGFSALEMERRNEHKPIIMTNRDAKRVRVQIDRIMRNKGPKDAYAYAKTLFPYDRSFVSQHLVLHIFSELAYARYGRHGLNFCDNDFAYGCLHGFLAQIIVHEGLDNAKELFAECRNQANEIACQHGIGHGIMQYLGGRNIRSGLDTCVRIGAEISAKGCFGGAYMEYHFPTLTAGGVESAVPFDPDNPYDICPGLPDSYKPSCYFRLAEWWEEILRKDYKKMGNLCSKIGNTEYMAQCLRAIGATATTTSGHDKSLVAYICSQATQSPNYRDICLKGFDMEDPGK